MIALVILVPIFGYALIFNIFAKRSVSASIFFAISSIIVAIFFFGMVDFLKYGTYFVFYGGILSLIVMVVIDSKKVLNFITSVPSVIYLVASSAYLYFMQDAQFFFWDEYSHWGAFIKEMYYFGYFYDANSVAANRMYPPGISIWDYFIVLPTGYKEGSIYFAYFLILFSSVLMMYEKLQWRQVHWIALIFITQMSVFATYGHWFTSIYVDHVVGAFVAGIVLVYLTEEFSDKELFLFSIPLVTLVLFKEVGLYFGVVFLGLVFIMRMYQSSGNIIKRLNKQKKAIAILVVLLILIVSILKIWEARQESKGLTKSAHSLSTLVTNISNNKKPYDNSELQNQYNHNFLDTMWHQQLHQEKTSLNYNEFTYGTMSKFTKDIKLSTIGTYLFILFVFCILAIVSSNKNNKIIVILLGTYLILTSIIYLIILYLSMPLSFGNRALNMVSYVRYINISMMPLLFIMFGLFLPLYSKEYNKNIFKQNINAKFLSLFLVISIFMIITRPYFKPLYSQIENPFRKQVNNIVPKILEHIPTKSKVLVVFPVKNNGSLNNILRYSMIPTRSTITKYNFFHKKTEKEVLKEFIKYDYIWFALLNQEVLNKSKQILKSKGNNHAYMLYKLEKQNNHIHVKPIL